MSTTNPSTFQVKLALDEGLKKTLIVLEQQYEALDKASIVRLALNNLAKTVIKLTPAEENELFQYFADLTKSGKGMTEKELADWWNENTASL